MYVSHDGHFEMSMIRQQRSSCVMLYICVVNLLFSAVSAEGRSIFSGMFTQDRQRHAQQCQQSAVSAYAEQVYRSARQHSDEVRASLGSLDSVTTTSLRGGASERVWDLFYPDYNCPLVKERLGRIGKRAGSRCADKNWAFRRAR